MRFSFLPKWLFRLANLHEPCLSDPPKKKEDRYGDSNTIHHTGHVDVEIGPTGEVCAVWFRCRMIPFKEHHVVDSRVASMTKTDPESLPDIKAIVFVNDFPEDAP